MRRRLVTQTVSGLNFSDTLEYAVNQEADRFLLLNREVFNRLVSRTILESSFDFPLLHIGCLKFCAT